MDAKIAVQRKYNIKINVNKYFFSVDFKSFFDNILVDILHCHSLLVLHQPQSLSFP